MKWLVALLFLGANAIAASADSTLASTALVQRLTTLLAAHHAEAIAAQLPGSDDRFAAALFYPDAQLLVVSASSPSAQLLRERISWKQYQEVYQELQGQAAVSGWFLYDMKADGLRTRPDQMADTWMEGRKPALVFDGDWKRQDLSQAQYADAMNAADARYTEVLKALIAEAEKTSPAAGTTSTASR